MSRIRNHSPAAPSSLSVHAIDGALPIGEGLIELLDVAYRARRPVLLEGPTGIGKSQVVEEFAVRAGIECRVLDLSLIEPPDLVGLPEMRDGRTHYACPAELPTGGRGVLMLEELNRAELPVMQPALQLLSARRLHAYSLPPDWFCVAAINPEDDDYQVNRLDPALRSRFLQVSVRADRTEWLRWAEREAVHPVLVQIVTNSLDVFDRTAPRSWAHLSDVLHRLRAEELQRRDLMLRLAQGFLPPAWALTVVESLERAIEASRFDLEALLEPGGAGVFADQIDALLKAGRTDAVTMLAWNLWSALAHDRTEPRLQVMSGEQLANMLEPLPGDLREQCLKVFVSRAHSDSAEGV